MQCAQGVLLFLVQVVNSARVQILCHALTLAACSYALLYLL